MSYPIRRTTKSTRTCYKCEGSLMPINHEDNRVDYDNNVRSSKWQLFMCQSCGNYWGITMRSDMYGGDSEEYDDKGKNLAYVRRLSNPAQLGYRAENEAT